jgi:hypothetical protein
MKSQHLDVERRIEVESKKTFQERQSLNTFYPNGHINIGPLPILECHNYAINTQKGRKQLGHTYNYSTVDALDL